MITRTKVQFGYNVVEVFGVRVYTIKLRFAGQISLPGFARFESKDGRYTTLIHSTSLFTDHVNRIQQMDQLRYKIALQRFKLRYPGLDIAAMEAAENAEYEKTCWDHVEYEPLDF
jgi:hypothetical protein